MSVAGQPVLGSTLQEGGLELQLTLLNATTGATLSDAHNPRPQEGLFSGVAGRHFEPTARLTGSTHTFKCKVLLLSSDIDDALIKIKVSRPNLAAADAADPLCVVTRAFLSRARSTAHETKDNLTFRSLGAAADDEGETFQDMSAGDDDGGVVFRSALNKDEEEEVEEEEDEEEDEDDDEEAAVLARTDSNQARTIDQLQRLLSGLESQQPMPSGPALLEALRMCRIGG